MEQDEDIESKYEIVEPDGELDFTHTYHSKAKGTSEYADRRYFTTDINNQNFNEPQLSTAVSHMHSRRLAANTQVHRYHFRDSESFRDQMCLNNTNFQDMIPPRLPKAISPQHNCGRNASKSKSNTRISGSQSITGPEVNRSLKPEKLLLQVKGGASNTHECYNGRLEDVKTSKTEKSLIQSNTFSPKLCGEKIGSPLSSRTSTLRPCKDQSRDGNSIQYFQTSPCNDTSPHWDHPKMDTKQVSCTSIQRSCKNASGRNDFNLILPPPPQGNGLSPKSVPSKSKWYLKEYDRTKAERILYQEHKDGVFLVRDNSHRTFNEPYVLSVYYENKVFHIKIRYLEDSQQYALGTGIRGNHKFSSVEDMIEFHRELPLLLVDGKSRRHFKGQQCFLTRPPILTGQKM